MIPVRKLGFGELVYDHELELGYHLLVYLTRFRTPNRDLYADLGLIEQAVYKWTNLNPFLRARVAVLDEPGSASKSKYFVLPSQTDSSQVFSSVKFYTLKADSEPTEAAVKASMDLFYEREFNIIPVDPRTGDRLWRLSFLKLGSSDYAAVLHIHHGITDGKNAYTLLEQLIYLIEQSASGHSESPVEVVTAMQPSLEELLFKGDKEMMQNIEFNPEFELSNRNKIPRCFAFDGKTPASSRNRFDTLAGYRFERPGETIQVADLVDRRDDLSQTVTKFKYFELDASIMKRLAQRARQENAKLTSYFNLVLSLAIHSAFEAFDTNDEALAATNQINFHLTATLRNHLQVDVKNMGFCSAFICGIQKITPDLVLKTDQNISQWQDAVWKAASSETASLHSRLKAGEHIEGVKADRLLFEDLQKPDHVFENGGCHFTMSNLGTVPSTHELGGFKITAFHHQVSMKEMRWSSVMFNGLTTVGSQLQWGITYNAKLLRDQVIDLIIDRCLEYVTKSV